MFLVYEVMLYSPPKCLSPATGLALFRGALFWATLYYHLPWQDAWRRWLNSIRIIQYLLSLVLSEWLQQLRHIPSMYLTWFPFLVPNSTSSINSPRASPTSQHLQGGLGHAQHCNHQDAVCLGHYLFGWELVWGPPGFLNTAWELPNHKIICCNSRCLISLTGGQQSVETVMPHAVASFLSQPCTFPECFISYLPAPFPFSSGISAVAAVSWSPKPCNQY